MRLIDLITEKMQPNSGAFNKIRLGYEGVHDTSCYTFVGRMLAAHGDELLPAVVAFYSLPGRDTYVHAAIEEPDGTLVDERRPPVNFRDENGKPIRLDFQRWAVPVSNVLDWLRTA